MDNIYCVGLGACQWTAFTNISSNVYAYGRTAMFYTNLINIGGIVYIVMLIKHVAILN